MTKKLSERIAERATAKAQGRNAKNKAQFLSVSFSYEAFRKHVNAWKNHNPEPQKKHQKEEAPPQITKSNELPGFKWNPIPNPDELF